MDNKEAAFEEELAPESEQEEEALPEGQELQDMLSALDDSAGAIRDLISSSRIFKYTIFFVEANVNHLKMMVEKDYIANSGKDLSTHFEAITLGEAFLKENPID